MKKINFALISDVIFFTLCTFFIAFAAIRYFFKSALTALIISVGIAAAAAILCAFILIAKRSKRLVYLLSENEKKSLALHLSVCGKAYLNNTFLNALNGAYMGDNGLEDENCSYFFNFKLSPLSPDDVAAVIREDSQKPKAIFCCAVSPEAASLAEDFSIKITAVAEIYMLLKKKGLLPEKYALGKVKKPNLLTRIKKRFNRRLCPSLFFGGITLLAFSLFTFYPVYYIVAGGILTALSAATLFISQSS